MSDTRVAVISVIAEDRAASAKINGVLSDYGEFVVGRMGIPYKQKGVFVICVVIDASMEVINTVTGKLGMIQGVSAKTTVSKK